MNNNKSQDNRNTSDVLENMVDDEKSSDRISMFALAEALHERGFGVLMVFFALPSCIPIPIVGLPTALAIPLGFLSFQMLLGRQTPWLPKFIGNRSFERSTLSTVVVKSVPFLRKIEKLLRPRFSAFTSDTWEKIVGFFGVLFSLAMFIPLPFTNLLPAFGILIISLGLLSRDGLFVLAGLLTGIAGLCVTTYILIKTPQLIIAIFD